TRQYDRRFNVGVHIEIGKDVHGRRASAHHGGRVTPGSRLIEEGVGVEAIALEGDKQGAGSQVSGVRSNAAEAELGRRAHAERFRDARARPLGHEPPSARTIARSSNGCFSVPITW